ncbi:MAG: ABC transporter permease [Chloroflexota bacterium]
MTTTNDSINDAPDAVPNPMLASEIQQSPVTFVRGYLRRLRAGDLGSLPIIVGLIIIAVIFQTQNENFLTPRNFVNLILQMAGITTIAYGVVFVLLLGEIDLSVGYVSAVAAVALTLMLRPPTVIPWYVALPLALLIAAAIGVLHGLIITVIQIPAFVVTLAGLLAWNGVVLLIIGEGGTIILQDNTILGLTNSYLPHQIGWLAGALFILYLAYNQYSRIRIRRSANLSYTPPIVAGAQVAFLGLLILIVIFIADQDRGVPLIGVILLFLLGGLSFLAERTRFGRYVYAIGGNKEAARRAGIKVEQIRIMVFMISSLMAGLGGIVLAARLRSVATNAGGGDLLLNSIAAAVIGGTSLFGGRGKVSSAVLGALVIASVQSGMGLLGLSAGSQFIVTGLVLLMAAAVDALSRRSQRRSGLA